MPEQWPRSYLTSFGPFVADPRSEKHLLVHVDKFVPSTQTELRVLDVCAGTGIAGHIVSQHILAKGLTAHLTLLDKSPNVLEREGDTDTRVQADVTLMPQVPTGRFDIAVCRYGFNNLPREDWSRAINEVLRVVKPGGLFLLQDHFVPGPAFSALVNEAEAFLARLEGKEAVPFIFSTEAFNTILDEHPLVASRVKSGYGLFVNIWERLLAKRELIPDYEIARREILRFYEEVCLSKFKVLIVDADEPIPVYNVTFAIQKRTT